MLAKETLDCALLPYQGKFSLLPMLAIAELIAINDITGILLAQKKFPIVGEYHWQQSNLPVIGLDFSDLPLRLYHPKLAIIRSLVMSPAGPPCYAAMLFEGTPKRLKIHADEIRWLDEDAKLVLVHLPEEIKATIFDLNDFSQRLQNLQGNNDTDTA